jgi:hypothetical protein
MNDEDSKRVYRQPLNYENGVLLPKIRDIALWRDTNIKAYESGVITLALLLPGAIRKKCLEFWKNGTAYEDLTMDGKKEFDDLFVFILQNLEDNNICFPKLAFKEGKL